MRTSTVGSKKDNVRALAKSLAKEKARNAKLLEELGRARERAMPPIVTELEDLTENGHPGRDLRSSAYCGLELDDEDIRRPISVTSTDEQRQIDRTVEQTQEPQRKATGRGSNPFVLAPMNTLSLASISIRECKATTEEDEIYRRRLRTGLNFLTT